MAQPSSAHSHRIFRACCAACRKTQTEWYRRLAKEGFRDLEVRRTPDGHLTGDLQGSHLGTKDAERSMVSLDAAETHDVADGGENGFHDNAALQENLDTFGEVTTVWDTPVAQRWRFYSQEVDQLPAEYPRRAFLVLWAELGGDVVNAAKETRVTRWQGREAVRKLRVYLKKIGHLR